MRTLNRRKIIFGEKIFCGGEGNWGKKGGMGVLLQGWREYIVVQVSQFT
jgi:hypothetical protein